MTEVNYIKNKVYVCIDSYENEILSGRFYHIGVNEKKEFTGIEQLLIEMENIFDNLNYPASATKHRTFNRSENIKSEFTAGEDFKEEELKGKIATFMVHVRYRQNATWQGNITWIEQEKSKTFRSDMEFIKLINMATKPLA